MAATGRRRRILICVTRASHQKYSNSCTNVTILTVSAIEMILATVSKPHYSVNIVLPTSETGIIVL